MDKKTVHKIIRQTRENYNTIASEWHVSRFAPSGIKKKLLGYVKPGMKTLDVGCGNAFIAPLVFGKGARYIGIDTAKNLIKIAKKTFAKEVKAGAAQFRVGDLEKKLPFTRDSFDAILCFAVLHHIPSEELRQKVLKEFARVLKPGAAAYIIVWNVRNAWANNRFKIEEQLANTRAGLDKGDVFVPWKATAGKKITRYLHVFDKAELTRLCREAGFKKVSVGYYNRAGKKEKNGEELVVIAQK